MIDSKTQFGLLFLISGSILNLIFAIVYSIFALIISDKALISIIKMISNFQNIGSILIIIGAVLFFIGRKEFGKKHHNNVNIAFNLFAINFVLILVYGSGFYFLINSAMSQINSSSISIFYIIVLTIIAILGGLTFYFALIELEDEFGKKVLISGIISSILISIISYFIIIGMISDIIESISLDRTSALSNVYQSISGIALLSIIPSILYIIALYIPYKRIKQGKSVAQFKTDDNLTIPQKNCILCNRKIPYNAVKCPYCGRDYR
jgi:hypothetical protein